MTHLKHIITILLAACILTIAGCSTPSKITLNDNSVIYTKDTPKFDKKSGFYTFESIDGNGETQINKDQVQSIEQHK